MTPRNQRMQRYTVWLEWPDGSAARNTAYGVAELFAYFRMGWAL